MNEPQPLFSPRYVRTVVAMLTCAVFIEFFHRQLLAVAMKAIGDDLALSDTQLGSLVTAFAVAYFVNAIVLGRAADRLPRRVIYPLGIALWSAATAAGASMAQFSTFFASRVVTGLGQASAGAANSPLLADYVTPDRRGSALGLITMGATLGSLVAGIVGGLVIEHASWRALFLGGGALGVAFSAVFAFVVREPPRGWSEGRAHVQSAPVPLGEVLRTIAAVPALLHSVAGAIVNSIAVFAGAQWAVVFFMRVHDFSQLEASLTLAGGAFFGTLGALAGGIVANRAWTRNPRAVLLVPALCCLIAFPVMWGAASLRDTRSATVLFLLGWAFALLHSAPAGAVMQALIPDRMRGFVSGLIAAVLTLVGMGGGPFITGFLSDLFGAATHPESIGRALAWISLLYVWAAAHFALAARTFKADLARGAHNASTS